MHAEVELENYGPPTWDNIQYVLHAYKDISDIADSMSIEEASALLKQMEKMIESKRYVDQFRKFIAVYLSKVEHDSKKAVSAIQISTSLDLVERISRIQNKLSCSPTELDKANQLKQHLYQRLSDVLVPKRDRDIIVNGLKLLMEKLESVPAHKLPNIILQVETSARPLMSAVHPILKRIYDSKGVKLPFVSDFQSLTSSAGDAFKHDHQKQAKYNYKKDYFDSWIRDDPSSSTLKDLFMEENKEIIRKRALMMKRVQDILRPQALSTPRVLVIDDYTRAKHTTFQEIFQLFKTANSKITMIGFAFLANEIDPYKHEFNEKEQRSFDRYYKNLEILANPDPNKVETIGFAYRTPGRTRMFSAKDQETVIGVAKDTKQSRVSISPNRDSRLMTILTRTMYDIGKEFADHLPVVEVASTT